MPVLLLLGILAVAALLRAPITSVPPALPEIIAQLGLSPALAGATTSLPLVCFGVFAFATPFLVARFDLERTMYAVLVPLLLGLGLRSAGPTWAFFAGAVLLGSGIAIGNVLVPALIRTRFPLKVAALMGAYTAALQVSGSVGAAATTPLQEGLHWDWRLALGVWVVPTLVALLLWMVVSRRPHAAGHGEAPRGLGHLLPRPLTWGITVFMGLQSLSFYTLVTWLPTQLGAVGIPPASAGALAGLFNILGLPGAFIAPRLVTSGRVAPTVVGTYLAQALGLLLLVSGPAAAVVGTVLCGLAQGAGFAVALTYVADQRDHRDVPALSALSQGVGYALAALGPVLVGALYAASGERWLVPNLAVVAVSLVLIVVGVPVGRRLHRDKAAPAPATG